MSKPAKTIRMNEEVYHEARVAAVMDRKPVGQWIEEAIMEKVEAAGGNDPKASHSPQ